MGQPVGLALRERVPGLCRRRGLQVRQEPVAVALGAREAPPPRSLVPSGGGGLNLEFVRGAGGRARRLRSACARSFCLAGHILLGAAGHLGQFGPALLVLSQEWKRRERFR